MSTTEKRTREQVDSDVLSHLRANAPEGTTSLSIREVGAAIGVPFGTVQQAMRRLEQAGKLQHAGKDGRRNSWRILAA